MRITECEDSHPKAIREVVSLRWTQSESFDKKFVSKVTTRGTMVVRADLREGADTFRALCTPPLLPDYQRESADYTISGSGTELDFTFVDLEKDRLPPFPAVEASGRFTVTVLKPGVQRFGQVDIKLDGQPGTSRTDLLVKAYGIAAAKLRLDGFATDKNKVPVAMIWGSFSEDLFEPSIQLSMQARLRELGKLTWFEAERAIVIARAGGVAPPAVMPSVGQLPGADGKNRPGIAPPVRKRLLGLIAAAFRDPCAEVAAGRSHPGSNTPNQDMLVPGQGNFPPANIQIGQPGLDYGGGGDFGYEDNGAYDSYRIQSEYKYDPGYRPMPGTGVGPNGTIAAAVSVHGGIMTLDVTWFAARTGQPPVLPSFLSSNPNFVPLPSVVIPCEVVPSADGSLPSFEVAGHYQYLVLDPSKASVLAPVPPFLSSGVQRMGQQAAGYYSDDVLWTFQGSQGPNPFAGRTSGSQPNVPLNQPNGSGGSGGTGQPPPTGGLNSGSGGGIVGGDVPVYP